jgi:hypothetical protein
MANELRYKSIHDLRGMAQAFGITDIFEKDVIRLSQEIELKQKELIPAPVPLPPRPEYDARLMDKPPGRRASMEEMLDLLEPYIIRGLKVTFDEEHWFMHSGVKNDTGTIRMPLKHVLEAARKVMI